VVSAGELVSHRILFVEDDEQFLADLRLILPQSLLVQVATTAAEARTWGAPPDVAFVDLGLPDGDGVALISELCALWPNTPLVVLTVTQSDARILAAFRAGARGYLFKEDAALRLPQAIREALEGGAPMSRSVARTVLRIVSGLPAVSVAADRPEALTEQELNVVRSLADGCSYLQAATELRVSVNTLRSHVRNVYRKLCVGTRTEAVMTALQLGLLERR
jgi:DNA-binding NarL/FixJ family response regulator